MKELMRGGSKKGKRKSEDHVAEIFIKELYYFGFIFMHNFLIRIKKYILYIFCKIRKLY